MSPGRILACSPSGRGEHGGYLTGDGRAAGQQALEDRAANRETPRASVVQHPDCSVLATDPAAMTGPEAARTTARVSSPTSAD